MLWIEFSAVSKNAISTIYLGFYEERWHYGLPIAVNLCISTSSSLSRPGTRVAVSEKIDAVSVPIGRF